jgi:hypothetical protein
MAASTVAIPAQADDEVLTFLHMKRSFPTFHGTIDSRDERCVEGRTVELLMQRKRGEDKLLGRDEAKANGHWKVNIAAGSGRYYAKAPRLESASRDLICKAARSRGLIVD